MSVRIFIADDHDIVREGIKSLLRSRPDWLICGEASNGDDAISGIRDFQPEAAVVDISMPGVSGLEVTKQVLRTNPDMKLLIFTMHAGKTLSDSAREAGAKGLVLKSFAARDLVKALETIVAGGTFFEEP